MVIGYFLFLFRKKKVEWILQRQKYEEELLNEIKSTNVEKVY